VLVPTGQRASGEWIDDTLRARVEEKGLLARTPLAGDFPRQRVELVRGADPTAEVNRLYRLRGWTDGLPIVPPTLSRIDEMLASGSLEHHLVLGEVEPLGGVATVEKIAANAVMAGCRAEYFPVVLAAVLAILDPVFNLRGVQTTDENVAPLIVVNGPVAQRIGLNAAWGALGPGWPANAAIGRAVRLVMNNLGGGWPGAVSFAGLGQPARWTLCLAERAEDTPWPPLHVELGYGPQQSTVTVLRAETVINVTGGLDELASVIGSAASLFGILHSGKAAVILSPFTVRRLAGEGAFFGSHMATHRAIDGLSSSDLAAELLRSRMFIERWTGRPTTAFAAPFSVTDRRLGRLARECGYRIGFGGRHGPAGLDGDPIDLPRIEIRGDRSLDDFVAIVEAVLDER